MNAKKKADTWIVVVVGVCVCVCGAVRRRRTRCVTCISCTTLTETLINWRVLELISRHYSLQCRLMSTYNPPHSYNSTTSSLTFTRTAQVNRINALHAIAWWCFLCIQAFSCPRRLGLGLGACGLGLVLATSCSGLHQWNFN